VITSDGYSPRGPLSTAISILCRDGSSRLPAPDRVDLRATCFIYERLEQPLTPAELADGLNVSLRSLQRGLSGALGCTPRELILGIKMREAKRSLLEDRARVQEAARAVGFDDPFHFSRRFKAYYRVSPTEMQDRVGRHVA
jgi:AraC-like DNA-binding protein